MFVRMRRTRTFLGVTYRSNVIYDVSDADGATLIGNGWAVAYEPDTRFFDALFAVNGNGDVVGLVGPDGQIADPVIAVPASGASLTQTAANRGVLDITLTANLALGFTNVPRGAWSIRLILRQGIPGSRLVTWPANVRWAAGTPPVLSTFATAVDIVDLMTIDRGVTWFGSVFGQQLGQVQLLRDTFARGNSTTTLGSANTGQAWSALSGTWGVVSNRGYREGINTTDSVASINVGAPWVSYEALVLPTTEFPGLAFDITDVNNFYVVLVGNDTQRLQLTRRVAGSYTLIQEAVGVFPAGVDVRVEIVRSGASKVVKANGTTVINVTDSNLAVTNSVGFRFQTNAGTNLARWSDITVRGASV